MKKILYVFILLSIALNTFLQCKSSPKNSSDENTQDNSHEEVVIQNKDEASSSSKEWPSNYYEGWVGSTTVQAFYTGLSDQISEDDERQARVRLAWLMLLESYNLTREDMPVAERLAESRLFEELGEETLLNRRENHKIMIYIKKTDPALKEKWDAALFTMENKIPRLKNLRK